MGFYMGFEIDCRGQRVAGEEIESEVKDIIWQCSTIDEDCVTSMYTADNIDRVHVYEESAVTVLEELYGRAIMLCRLDFISPKLYEDIEAYILRTRKAVIDNARRAITILKNKD